MKKNKVRQKTGMTASPLYVEKATSSMGIRKANKMIVTSYFYWFSNWEAALSNVVKNNFSENSQKYL